MPCSAIIRKQVADVVSLSSRGSFNICKHSHSRERGLGNRFLHTSAPAIARIAERARPIAQGLRPLPKPESVLPIDMLIPVLARPTLTSPEALIESARAPLLHLKFAGVHDPPTATFPGQTPSYESGSMTGQ